MKPPVLPLLYRPGDSARVCGAISFGTHAVSPLRLCYGRIEDHRWQIGAFLYQAEGDAICNACQAEQDTECSMKGVLGDQVMSHPRMCSDMHTLLQSPQLCHAGTCGELGKARSQPMAGQWAHTRTCHQVCARRLIELEFLICLFCMVNASRCSMS